MYPTNTIHLRELSRQTNLSMPTIIDITTKLEKQNLLSIQKTVPLTIVKANLNEEFTWRKRLNNIEQLYESGLIQELKKSHPRAIILFGSYSKGEDTEKSDIDIAIIGKTTIDIRSYEDILKRKISIHTIHWTDTPKEFKENLYNGIVLDGAM